MIDIPTYFAVEGGGDKKRSVRKGRPKGKPAPCPDKKPASAQDKKEMAELLEGICSHPALAPYKEEKRKYVLWGDIQRPTEFDKHICEHPKLHEAELAQVAWLARETAYVGRHLARWVEEDVEGGIAEWYMHAEQAFTYRVRAAIETSCKETEAALALRLPHLRDDFKRGYEELLEQAGRCDIKRVTGFGPLPVGAIDSFRLAAATFYKVIYDVHGELRIALAKLAPRSRPGHPKNIAAEKSMDELKRLLEEEVNFTKMPRQTRRKSWEWVVEKIHWPYNPANRTDVHKIMQGYLRKNCPTLYKELKRIVEKN